MFYDACDCLQFGIHTTWIRLAYDRGWTVNVDNEMTGLRSQSQTNQLGDIVAKILEGRCLEAPPEIKKSAVRVAGRGTRELPAGGAAAAGIC